MKSYKIGIAGITHETITFWPGLTTLEGFASYTHHGQDMIEKLSDTNTCTGGFIDVCHKANATPLPICIGFGGATATVADDVFDYFADKIVSGFKEIKDDLDGILLDLHGAMVTESRQDPETDLVKMIRDVVGYEIPLMVTMDLHGNKVERLLEEATAVFGFQSSPHIDMNNTGLRAGNALIATLNKEIKPKVAMKKPGIVVPSVFSATTVSPGKDIIERLHYWMNQKNVVDVTALFGFAWSDVKTIGMSMIAVTDDDPALAEKIVDDLCALATTLKKDLTGRKSSTLYSLEDGVKLAIEKSKTANKPIIILDHADRSNDTTFILKELLKQKAENVALPCIYDPTSASQCIDKGVGNRVTLEVGANTGWSDGGKVTVEGEILWAGEGKYKGTGPMDGNIEMNLGPTAIIKVEGIWLQVISKLQSLIDDDPIKQFGFTPEDFDIIVTKSKTHFRAVFEKMGEEIIIIDAPGQCPADLSRFEYHNVPDNTYPINLLD